jgi:hypothetical protein
MIVEHLPLARQVDLVFKEIFDELSFLTSGIVFLQIRNNIIGKFGIRHDPIEGKDGSIREQEKGLTEQQLHIFRQMAIQSLKHKKGWTHGEICFEFAVKNNILCSSVQFESNYNMANLILKLRKVHEY